ncbi:MAG: 26S protease regulatory subunit [Steroidobacteraceae bacterium]
MDSTEQLQFLERKLLSHPFDRALRLEYADALRETGQVESALAQYELLLGQPDAQAAAALGAACCLLVLGRRSDAVDRYTQAKRLPGFEPHEELDVVAGDSRRVEPPRLSVIPGYSGADEKVVPIEQALRDKVRFDDVAGMHDLKRTIRMQIIEPFLRPGLFAKFKKRAGGGVLLYGPPGCGKTMIARAVAGECRAEFVSVGISDVLSMWIGQSESNLALLFEKARSQVPSVLFFDELDALAYSRSKANSEHTRQVVNEFLAQLDGFGADNQGVLILAATNMPWDVDSAMKRPGRFARQIFVPPPDELARAEIFRLKLEGVPSEAIDFAAAAKATPHFSGADIEGAVELAKEYVLEQHIANNVDRPIGNADVARAVRDMRPSTLDWLRTARNLVKYAGADDAYREVGEYLKRYRIF